MAKGDIWPRLTILYADDLFWTPGPSKIGALCATAAHAASCNRNADVYANRVFIGLFSWFSKYFSLAAVFI